MQNYRMLLSLSNTLFSFLVPAPSPASRPGLVPFLPPVLPASCGEPSEESPACSELSLSSATHVVWVCFHATIRVRCYSLCLCSRHIDPSSWTISPAPRIQPMVPLAVPTMQRMLICLVALSFLNLHYVFFRIYCHPV